MKRILPFLFLILAGPAFGQVRGSSQSVVSTNATPSGSCSGNLIQIKRVNPMEVYMCLGGTWTQTALAGSLSDGDKGDITVASSGTVWTIDSGALNFSELAGAATDSQVPNDITINTATLASTVTVADAASDTTTYPTLAGSATGSLAVLTDAGLSYNASTDALTATTFVGALTGNVTGNASTATSATGLACTNCVGDDEISLTSEAQGAVTYYNGTNWVVLGPGTDGQYLETNGAGANPSWSTVSGSGDVLDVGNCTSGACFDGTSDGGSSLIFYNAGGNVTLSWDGTTLNSTEPISVSDQGDGSRYTTFSDNTTEPSAPGDTTPDSTILYTLGGAFYKKDEGDSTNERLILDSGTVTGDVTFSSAGAATIGSDKILESMLKSVNAATDEYCLTAETTTGDFEWQTCSSGGGDSITVATTAATDPDFISTGQVTFTLDTGATPDTIAANITNGSVVPADMDVTGEAWDFGGTTSFEIPNGTGPTVDAAGEVAVDTTDDQLVYYGGAKRVIPYEYEACVSLEDPVEADDDVPFFFPRNAITITDVYCQVDGGTSISMTISDGTNAMEAITCDGDGAEDDGTPTNNTFTSLERIEFDLASPSGTNTWLTVCITYTVDAQ
jgi:hypothetical protein